MLRGSVLRNLYSELTSGFGFLSFPVLKRLSCIYTQVLTCLCECEYFCWVHIQISEWLHKYMLNCVCACVCVCVIKPMGGLGNFSHRGICAECTFPLEFFNRVAFKSRAINSTLHKLGVKSLSTRSRFVSSFTTKLPKCLCNLFIIGIINANNKVNKVKYGNLLGCTVAKLVAL